MKKEIAGGIWSLPSRRRSEMRKACVVGGQPQGMAVVIAQRVPIRVIRRRVTVSFDGMRRRVPDCHLLRRGRWDSTMRGHCVVIVHIDDDLTMHGLPEYASPATSIGIGITRHPSRLRCRWQIQGGGGGAGGLTSSLGARNDWGGGGSGKGGGGTGEPLRNDRCDRAIDPSHWPWREVGRLSMRAGSLGNCTRGKKIVTRYWENIRFVDAVLT